MQSSPRLIELRADEGDNVEGIHDRGRVGHHFGGGFLVSGEGIHSDVIDAVLKVSGWFFSQSAKTSAERPGAISSRRAGRWVRSTMTVTQLSMPRWGQQCSSTPIVDTPSSRETSTISGVLPRSSTAVHTVFQEVARFFAMTWMLILSMTTDFGPHKRAVRESFDRPTQVLLGVWDQWIWQPGQV